MLGQAVALLDSVQIDLQRRQLTHEDHVVTLTFAQVGPDGAVREGVEEGLQLALNSGLVGFIERHIKREIAAGVEVLFDGLEIFLRIERRGAFDKDIEGIGGDDVELIGGCE